MSEYIFNDNGQGNNFTTPPDRYARIDITPVAAPEPEIPHINGRKHKKQGTHKGLIASLLVACVLFGGAAGFGGSFAYDMLNPDTATNYTLPPFNNNADANTIAAITPAITSEPEKYVGTYSEVAAAVSDTVVVITTETAQQNPYFQQYVVSGAGSGVVITSDGYILTNNHVVDGASTVKVTLANGTEYTAKIIGGDEESDIAIIKIEATGLLAAKIGDSDKLIVGEEVIAIGNPLGTLGGTVTNGIVSALRREINVEGQTMVLLQTNAAVNPGNSGGGLFNLSGELIGIVNAKWLKSGVEGLGFAIPINEAYKMASEIVQYGYVRGRVTLGIDAMDISMQSMFSFFGGYYNIPGVYVENPNQQTELQEGDRITTIDGIEVTTVSEIKAVLSKHAVGDVLTASVSRNGRIIQVSVTCLERKS
jgi:serine protease Do